LGPDINVRGLLVSSEGRDEAGRDEASRDDVGNGERGKGEGGRVITGDECPDMGTRGEEEGRLAVGGRRPALRRKRDDSDSSMSVCVKL
jgi:hypothetical protein